MEIRKYQKSTNLLLRKGPFSRLVSLCKPDNNPKKDQIYIIHINSPHPTPKNKFLHNLVVFSQPFVLCASGEGGVPDVRQRLHEVAGSGSPSPAGGKRALVYFYFYLLIYGGASWFNAGVQKPVCY